MTVGQDASSDTDVPVLFAGGGLVGLSTAMFLAQHGIPSLAVERLRSGSQLPRAAFFHMRTLEMFRSAGIEDEVRAQSIEEFEPEGAHRPDGHAGRARCSPTHPEPQRGRRCAQPLPAAVRHAARARADPAARAPRGRRPRARRPRGGRRSTQDAAGVTTTVRDVETRRGADHPREVPGRRRRRAQQDARAAGIEFDGRGVFSNSITIYFKAPLAPLLAGKNFSVIYVNNADLGGFFRLDKDSNSGFLVVNTVGDTSKPEAASPANDVSEETLIEHVRHAARRRRSAGDDHRRRALARDLRRGAPVPGRPRLPRRRRRAPDAAQRRLRRQHRHPRRAQPRVEAGARAEGRRRPAAARHLRGGAPAGGEVHRRAGVHALRDAHRAVPRRNRTFSRLRRLRHRARLPLPLSGASSQNRRPARRADHEHPSRVAGPSGLARAPLWIEMDGRADLPPSICSVVRSSLLAGADGTRVDGRRVERRPRNSPGLPLAAHRSVATSRPGASPTAYGIPAVRRDARSPGRLRDVAIGVSRRGSRRGVTRRPVGDPDARVTTQGAVHAQLAASWRSPDPLYFAYGG